MSSSPRMLLAALAVLALVPIAVIAATSIGADDERAAATPEPVLGNETRTFAPEGEAPFADREQGGGRGAPVTEASPASRPVRLPRPRRAACHPIAYVSRAVTLRSTPGGPVRIRIAARTQWQSPRILGVVRRRQGWLAVQAPELGNGEVGWLRAGEARVSCVRWSLHADLSRRLLVVRNSGQVVRRLSVAVGAASNPTPQGRFSVTDKLRVTAPGSPYGCCVLALTGHQQRLPAGWPGGDRLAVHATNDLPSIGQPASLGCLRAHPSRARWLIETIPLGAPIFIRS
jgi:hypothetical protein